MSNNRKTLVYGYPTINRMRIQSTKEQDAYKVWMTEKEAAELLDYAENRGWKHHVVALLGLRCGLRATEIAGVTPNDIVEDDNGYWLHIRGKDTTGEHGDNGKQRRVPLPTSVATTLYQYIGAEGVNDDSSIVGVVTDRVRQIVKELGVYATQKSGNEDWEKISSHDLRRYYAQDLLVRKGADVRAVMAAGGWDSYDAIEPYLREPTPENVSDEILGVLD